MIISHTHKYIFIKSTKTAGTSIEAALSSNCSGNDIVTKLGDYVHNRDQNGEWVHNSMNAGDYHQHDRAITIKEKVGSEIWDNYFKFSIARNPWERIVSRFTWESRNNPAFKPRRRFSNMLGIKFNEFQDTKKLFLEYLKGDWETNDSFYIIDGELCVDFIIRYENLVEDFITVCKKTGLPEITLPHLKSGFRKGPHYSKYYTEEGRKIVADRHKNDIRLFHYQFEVV